MKITQETNEFKPITIVLETRDEAVLFRCGFNKINFYEFPGDLATKSSMFTIQQELARILYAR